MNPRFELSGPLTEISSYPQWAQDMVGDCDRVKRTVVDHELWDLMSTNALGDDGTANFMIGIWPVIERFPGYMAQSLLEDALRPQRRRQSRPPLAGAQHPRRAEPCRILAGLGRRRGRHRASAC